MTARFVSSRDIPEELAEPVAYIAHRRACGSFDGVRLVPSPQFAKRHRNIDVLWAQIYIADLCNALRITPSQILALRGGAAADSRIDMEAT